MESIYTPCRLLTKFRFLLFAIPLLLTVFIGQIVFAASSGSTQDAGTCDGKGCTWALGDYAGADGWYVAKNKAFGNGRNTRQVNYESVPQPGDKDAAAFIDWFSSSGVTTKTLPMFHDKIASGEIKCRGPQTVSKVKYPVQNTRYRLYDNSGDGTPLTNLNTVKDIERSDKAVDSVNECTLTNDAYPDGEVIYAERINCANPVYANFKLLTEEPDEKGDISTEAFIRRTGEGDDKFQKGEETYTVEVEGRTYSVGEISVEKGKKVDFKHVSKNNTSTQLSNLQQHMAWFKAPDKLTAADISITEDSQIVKADGKEYQEKKPIAAGGDITTVGKSGLKEIDTSDLGDTERYCQINIAITEDIKKVEDPLVESNVVCVKIGESEDDDDDPPETELPEIPGLPNLPDLPGTPTPPSSDLKSFTSNYHILAESVNLTTDSDYRTLGYDYDAIAAETKKKGVSDDIPKQCTLSGITRYGVKVYNDNINSPSTATAAAALAASVAAYGLAGGLTGEPASGRAAQTAHDAVIEAAARTAQTVAVAAATANKQGYADYCKDAPPAATNQIEWISNHEVKINTGYPKKIKEYSDKAKKIDSTKNGSASDTADIKFGINYAKPTDRIAFRNRVDKEWWDVEPTINDAGKVPAGTTKAYAPSRMDSSGKETCKVTTPFPNTNPAKHPIVDTITEKGPVGGSQVTVLRMPTEPDAQDGFVLEKSCKSDGTKLADGTEITNLFKELRPNENGYLVRRGYTAKIGATSVNNDVGKKFVDQIDAKPTYAYPDQYTCINPNTNYTVQTAPGECKEFGTTKVTETNGAGGAQGVGWSAAQINVPFNYSLTPITYGRPNDETGCLTYEQALGEAASGGGTANDHVGCPTDPETNPDPSKRGFPNYGIVYAGENFTFASNIITDPRANPDVWNSTDTYATYTRKTDYKIVSFALAPNSPTPTGYGFSSSAPSTAYDCGYYGGTATSPLYNRPCINLKEADNQVYNQTGAIDGTGNFGDLLDKANNEVNVIIDDLPVGTKICFAAAVYPADSHGYINANTGKGKGAEGSVKDLGNNNPENDGRAMTDDGGSGDYWAYGAPYCVTIAKKPNFQVWAGGTYAGGSIATTQSPKHIKAGANGDPYIAQTRTDTVRSISNNFRRLFGSWTEQEVISLGGIGGFASGAALGYKGESNASLSNGYPGHDDTANQFNSINKTTDSTNMTGILCQFSKITISNKSCATYVGSAGLDTMNPLILDRLLNRYLGATGNGPGEKAKLTYHIVYCTKAPGTNDSGSCSGDGVENTDGGEVVVPKGKVYVYDLRGAAAADKVIAHNIRYEDATYKGISELPQAIIVSGDLTVDPDVVNIDAWIINLYTGEDEGLFITCPDEPENAIKCNKPLTVNGPIFAYGIKLNRTYGAFGGSKTCNSINSSAPTGNWVSTDYAQDTFCTGGDAKGTPFGNSENAGFRGSIAPAERFVLRADTFLWTYAQAQIVPKATSVHTYEPSPNF
jgi:hypothetical protein